ncbi:Lipopolysaccharide biosynthesis protein wzzE [Serratia entomophila]|nr:Lipopolysaccharide biosynthesis protein wzzE [Serratia entomophila]CAI1892927.1 Lipopolysaccharide biosynthesis protein wzzE [Serratia entomophila]CAI1913115.1 Lipopolysaccharide biosynthesis protein wzzE [Serratia entomophila]CAI1961231.1 Lipopolysaccharide biosynthesis protein wzzE [Serratia entomophila]
MMNPETTSDKNIPAVDNELDIRGLCRTLWRGKRWIIGIAALFAAVALIVSYLVKQEWSATAITDRPTVNALGGYYSQQQFLRNLDVRTLPAVATEQPGIADEAYNEFIMQLAAYDTRRDFWLQSDYYKQRQEGDARVDAAKLDELINNIQFTPRDDKKTPNDGVKLTAETAADANRLLRQYVAFASHRAALHLNEEIQGAWAARTTSMKAQVKRQEAVAEAVYKRELNSIQQALKIAETQGISRTQTDTPAEQLRDSDLFLLGKPMLQARLEGLQASGPAYDLDYDQNRAMLSTLNVGPTLDEKFQTYRYLRTPEEPVKRDSPRRVFWLILWGAMGALVGAGIALARRPRD